MTDPIYCPPFSPMNDIIPEGRSEHFYIEHFYTDEEEVKARKLAGLFSFEYVEYYDLVPGHYIRLVDDRKNETVMTDTPMERRSNLDFVRRAHGHVLIGGLGIGMVVKALDDKLDVSSITVIEVEQEIIDLVLDDLQQSCLMQIEVIHADINEWRPPKGIKYNAIYFDIWNNVNGDNYEEMKFLHRSWAQRVDRTDKFFFESWRKRDTKERVW